MREPPCSLEEVENYDFLQAWKSDDIDWLNQRRRQWPAIQKKIEQMRRTFDDKDLELDKSDYKSIKSYYLTGFIRPVTDEERKTWVFNFPSEAHGTGRKLGLIFSFWLSPDHSWENWQRLKSANMYEYNQRLNKKDGSVSDYKLKHNTINLRRMVLCYPGTKPWPNFESRGRQISPFKGSDAVIEDDVMQVLIKGLPIDEVDLEGYPFSSPIGDYLSVIKGYLGGGDAMWADFNPNNPIRYFLNEILEHLKRADDYVDSSAPYKHQKILYSLIWYVVEHPENHHPLQVEVANRIKEGILVFKPEVSGAYQNAIDDAVALAREGIPAAFYKHGLWKTREGVIQWCKENSDEDDLQISLKMMDEEEKATQINKKLEYRVWYENSSW